LGGKQSPGSNLCKPPFSHSCSPISRGNCLKNSLCVSISYGDASANKSRQEYQLCSCSPMEEAIALEAMRWRFKSSQEYQNIRVWCSLVCTPVLGTGSRRFKSYHSDLWVVGRADMQPPFKRNNPGSTPGQPTKFKPCLIVNFIWAFGRTVMHLILNQTDTGISFGDASRTTPFKRNNPGSTPGQPTKSHPCSPIGRGTKLKIWLMLVQIQSGVCGDGAIEAR
jgi:hypothetical protein